VHQSIPALHTRYAASAMVALHFCTKQNSKVSHRGRAGRTHGSHMDPAAAGWQRQARGMWAQPASRRGGLLVPVTWDRRNTRFHALAPAPARNLCSEADTIHRPQPAPARRAAIVLPQERCLIKSTRAYASALAGNRAWFRSWIITHAWSWTMAPLPPSHFHTQLAASWYLQVKPRVWNSPGAQRSRFVAFVCAGLLIPMRRRSLLRGSCDEEPLRPCSRLLQSYEGSVQLTCSRKKIEVDISFGGKRLGAQGGPGQLYLHPVLVVTD
jgi:hypothetical protein